MKKCYLGIDAGSYSIKVVIIDSKKNIICSSYVYNNNVLSIKKILCGLYKKIDVNKYKIVGVGVTGSYRKIIGLLLETNIIKNEIVCHGVGGNYFYRDIDTIIDVGKNNIKIININNNRIIDYSINNIDMDDMDEIEKFFRDKCFKKVSIQGGNSNNIINTIKKYANYIYINDVSYLMGAIGVALIVLNSGIEKDYNIKIEDIRYNVKEKNCRMCNNKCNVVCMYKNNKIVNYRGSKCYKKINELKF